MIYLQKKIISYSEVYMDIGTISAISMLLSVGGVFIALYILHGIGLSKMLRSCGFKKPFFAYLPFFRAFALGSLAEVFDDRRPVAKKHGRIFLLISIAYFVILGSYYTAYIMNIQEPIAELFRSVNALSESATENEIMAIIESFVSSSSAILEKNTILNALSYLMSLFSIIYSVYSCIVLFKVFSIFAPRQAFFFTVASIFVSNIQSIFIFIVKNRAPQNLRWQRKYDYEPPIL